MLDRSGKFIGTLALLASVASAGAQVYSSSTLEAPVPPAATTPAQATPAQASLPVLEIKPEAAIIGPDVHLRQVARWGRADAGFFSTSADIVVARLAPGEKTLTLDLVKLRETLEGAGLGGADVSIRGATSVLVTRLDWRSPEAQLSPQPEPKELEELLGPKGARRPEATPPEMNGVLPGGADTVERATPGKVAAPQAPTSSGPTPPGSPTATIQTPGKTEALTLREALHRDLAEHLGIKREDIELTFEPGDERVLRAAEPAFSWSIAAIRAGNLGIVRWSVTLWAGKDSATGRRVEIQGRARAWENQIVLKRGLAAGQQVREEDIEDKRVLVDRMPEEMRVGREQALMMQANRKLLAGAVLTGRTLDPMLLVRTGQLVTLTLQQGAFEVKAVGRAMEGGAFGATIRVKTEATGDVLQVTVSGPQEARLGPPVAKEER